MDNILVYLLLSLLFTALFFAIGAYIRCRKHWHVHLVHFHHAYLGLILLGGIGVSHYLANYPYFFVSVAAGLIVSDLIHHFFFKVPIRWDR